MKKKRALLVVMIVCLLASVFSGAALAESETPSVQVRVTIANGTIVLAQQEVGVTDVDGDGVLTINDALYLAHEAAFEGGAAAGYASETSDYGLSLSKLWGVENGGSYGYYVNNVSALSLADPIANGDKITAFVYTDLTAWSDMYSYFTVDTLTVKEGEPVELTLEGVGFDENWAPVTRPVADAVILIDGEATDSKTDAEGHAVSQLTAGSHVISAKSDTAVLVPPCCVATVEAGAATGTANVALYVVIAVLVIAAAVAVIVIATRKKQA